jgi:radical SAM protein with 4Fe4S-binding SPASM domain
MGLKKSIKQKRKRYFIARIIRSPLKLINTLLVMISYKLRLKKTYGLPVVLDIEPTNACNFRCPHCQVTEADWDKKNMSMEQFERIIDIFPHALRVKLQGMGEPFLNKNLIEFIEKTCSRKYWCEVTSNGSLLDRRPVKNLEKYKNFQLTISIDAPEKKLFEQIRPGSNFEQIIENVKELQASTEMDLAAWMVVEKDNESSVVGTIKLLKSINVTIFGLQVIVIDYAKEKLKSETIDKRINYDHKQELYSLWKNEASKEEVELDISDKLYDRDNPCPWPWQGVYLDVVGNVVPCCRIGDARVCSMGNINNTDFDDIWNSDKYRDFRDMHKENKIPKICSSCYKN